MKGTVNKDSFAHFKVPEHTQRALLDYLNKGWEPGSFLCAVLSNDFIAAAVRADHINSQHLPDIARFVVNEMPMGSWGSREAITGWVNGNDIRKEYEQLLMLDVLSGKNTNE